MSKSIAGQYIVASWPLMLLIGFEAALFPQVTVGYRWTVEFALAAFLLISLLVLLFGEKLSFARPSKSELIWIILPLAQFTLWSGLSCLWSTSWRNAMHHALLWGCYTIFYILVRSICGDQKTFLVSFKITGAVVLAISIACIIEFVGTPKPITQVFTTRYYPYAEALVSLLPLFVALGLKPRQKYALILVVISALATGMVLLTTSRVMFIACLTGLAVFGSLGWCTNKKLNQLGRAIAIFLLILGFTQLPFLWGSDQSITLADRFSGNDQNSVLSANSRFLLWGMAVEGFKKSPIEGIGGDNYFTDYKTLREKYSARDPGNPVLEIDENVIPERAHNEYLQILCELGLVGGLLFGWLLGGIAYMFILAVRKRASLITLGSLAGVIAFLIASGASSYSFRVPVNGLCFFFLLAVASQELLARERSGESVVEVSRKPWLPIVGIVISLSMLGFSIVRALSINHMANSQATTDSDYAEIEINKAIALDPSEPIFRFDYGQQLSISGQYEGAIPQLRLAIQDGLATSPSYFTLLADEMRSGRNHEAAETFVEALRVYPRSVFLRTAYSAFLKREGNISAATSEYQKALEINPKQAKSWQLAHDEGLTRLSQVANVDPSYFTPMELLPVDGALVLMNFQRRAD